MLVIKEKIVTYLFVLKNCFYFIHSTMLLEKKGSFDTAATVANQLLDKSE